MRDDPATWLTNVKSEATVFAEAYRLRLVGRLWWTNLLLVVLPAVCATAAAVFAARPETSGSGFGPPVAAWLAGSAAVLTAVHRALKCDEYQGECLRLSQEYRSIAAVADSALSGPEGDPQSLKNLSDKFALLTESAKAPLPTSYIHAAEKRTGYTLYRQQPRDVALDVT